MNLNDLGLPDHHREVAERFLAACQADERIVAAYIGGSHAAQQADKFSDLDLYFVTTDEAYPEFLAEKERFVHLLGEPLFLEDFGVPHGFCFILSNATEGEFWFGRESDYQVISSGAFHVLCDKKGLLSRAVFPPPSADPAAQAAILRRQIDWFWHELAHFTKAMGRGQLWFAFGQIEVMRRICIILARLDYNFDDAFLEEDEPHFKIDEALPLERLSALQATYCTMNFDAMLQAAGVLCRFYQELAPRLAREHHLVYPAALEPILFSQLEDLRYLTGDIR